MLKVKKSETHDRLTLTLKVEKKSEVRLFLGRASVKTSAKGEISKETFQKISSGYMKHFNAIEHGKVKMTYGEMFNMLEEKANNALSLEDFAKSL